LIIGDITDLLCHPWSLNPVKISTLGGGKSGEEDGKSGELTLPWNFPILEKIKLLELSG
jgi:hypothetical protein